MTSPEPGRFASWLVQDAPEAILVVDADGLIVFANPMVEALLGHRPDELVGRSYELLVPGGVRDRHRQNHDAYLLAPTRRHMGAELGLCALHRDGTTVPVEIALTPLTEPEGTLVGVFMRDIRDRQRVLSRLGIARRITSHLLGGRPVDDILDQVGEAAAELFDAKASWVIRFLDDGDTFDIVAAAGAGDALLGGRGQSASWLREALDRRETVRFDDASEVPNLPDEVKEVGIGASVIAGLYLDDDPFGVLVVSLDAGRRFTADEVQEVENLAEELSLALTLDATRASLERLALVAEDERIARDLHDTVVQRVYATAMGLAALSQRCADPERARLQEAIDELDDVMREIRNTIFDLRGPVAGPGSLRRSLRRLADRTAQHTGLAVRLRYAGPVDTLTAPDLSEDVQAVVQEALSNAVRHGGAREAEVQVSVDVDRCVLVIDDDGSGMPEHPAPGDGLANMARRAERRGGSCTVDANGGGGVRIVWSVPLGSVPAAPS